MCGIYNFPLYQSEASCVNITSAHILKQIEDTDLGVYSYTLFHNKRQVTARVKSYPTYKHCYLLT